VFGELVWLDTSQNNLDELGIVTRNKARVVVQGCNEEEGIDYEETFASIARIEAIIILIAFAAHMEFKLYQIDVKSVFLNGYLKEEVYVIQPLGFENNEFPSHVFKLDKVLGMSVCQTFYWKMTLEEVKLIIPCF